MRIAMRNSLQVKVFIILSFTALTAFYLSTYRQDEVVRLLAQLRPQHASSDKEAFIETALQTPIENAFDSQPIKDLCGKTTWTPGLIFKCDSPQGGVGNVENFFMNCVRFAIEAGAAFIVPQIMIRSQTDLSDLTTKELVDFSYLFDRAHFTNTLAEACPQMNLYESISDLSNSTTATAILLNPQDLATEFIYERILAKPSEWRTSFDAFLAWKNPGGISSTSPTLIEIHNVLLEFPLSYDSTSFVRNFGRIFRFRADARRLAATILFEMSTRLAPNLKSTSRITPHAFLGAHLRTASDATKAGWPGYDVQATAYIAQAIRHNISAIYIASGSLSDISRFRSDAALQGLTVVAKGDLLSGADLEELGRMTWDQQALVDFEVLSKGSQFGGIEQSSFAWKIALKRHLLSKKEDYLQGTQALEDEFSVLYGPSGQMGYFPLAMWP